MCRSRTGPVRPQYYPCWNAIFLQCGERQGASPRGVPGVHEGRAAFKFRFAGDASHVRSGSRSRSRPTARCVPATHQCDGHAEDSRRLYGTCPQDGQTMRGACAAAVHPRTARAARLFTELVCCFSAVRREARREPPWCTRRT